MSPSALLGEGLLSEAFLSTTVAGFALRSAICTLAHGSQGAESPAVGSPKQICVCQAVKPLVLVFSVLSRQPEQSLTWTHGPACGFIPTQEFSLGSLFPSSSCCFSLLCLAHTGTGLAALPASKPSSQALPVLWLTLNATYQRRNLLLFFHLASSGFIASMWAKGYFPLYGGEVIICSCVSSHCSRAMPFPNFTIGMLFVHLGWLWGLCSLWNLPAGTWERDHPSHNGDSAMTYSFISPLK